MKLDLTPLANAIASFEEGIAVVSNETGLTPKPRRCGTH